MFCQQEGISYRNKYMTRYMLHAMGYTQMAFMHPHLLVTNTIFLWFLRKMLLKYVATRMHLVMNLFCYIIRILIVMNVGSRNKKKKEWEIESKRSLKKFFNLSMFQSAQHTQKTNFDFCIQWRTFFLFFSPPYLFLYFFTAHKQTMWTCWIHWPHCHSCCWRNPQKIL